jgi:hypothetical protein
LMQLLLDVTVCHICCVLLQITGDGENWLVSPFLMEGDKDG